MKGGAFLLVTTMSLKDKTVVTDFLSHWGSMSEIRIVLLLEEKEVSNRGSELRRVVDGNVEIATYRAGQHKKKSPFLEAVWKVFAQHSNYDAYIFVNGDIFPTHPAYEGRSLDFAAIEDVLRKRRIIFAKRHDYTEMCEITSLYECGYDMFIVPSEMLGVVPSSILKSWQIGQVGWDYAFPLGICKDHCVTSTELSIYHKVHKSGSHADWSRAMLSLASSIDRSWLSDLSLSKRFMFRVLTIPLVLRMMMISSPSLVRFVQKSICYFYSRLLFYGFISDLLKDLDAIR